MKNFEKGLDKFIETMKEASDILKEVNLQMLDTKKTSKPDGVVYALYDVDADMYISNISSLQRATRSVLENALLYGNKNEAEFYASIIDTDNVIVAKKIIMKVVD